LSNKYNNSKDKGPRVIANRNITQSTIRVNWDDNSEIMKTTEALALAKQLELDLVLIVEKADPPVCKIVDLNKYLYEQKQKAKESKKRQRESATEQKEIRLGINTELNDLNTKAKHAQKFLEKQATVTLTVILRGRERAKHHLAIEVLHRFANLIDVELENISRAGNRVSAKIKNNVKTS
jgi:translation initiation factor IF-3